MDWGRCIICQKSEKEELQSPANSKRRDAGAGYTSFVRNLEEFQNLGITPAMINFEYLDEGQRIEKTLVVRKASWHKLQRHVQ